MKILVIAAHPDDEILGSGASVARWIEEGHEVRLAVLGEGITSRFKDRQEGQVNGEAALNSLQIAMQQAAGCLGLQYETIARDLPDNRFDSVDLLDVVKTVEPFIEEYAPQRVLTHHPGDLNIDHRITCEAVITATRPHPGCPVREIWSFEIPSATEWSFETQTSFKPNTFIDVSSTLGKKIDALKFYENEMRPSPHARSIATVKALARMRGHSVGVEAAEAFRILRSIQ